MSGSQSRQVGIFNRWGGAEGIDAALNHAAGISRGIDRYNSFMTLLGTCVDLTESAEIITYKVSQRMRQEKAWEWVGKTRADFEAEHNVARSGAIAERGRKSLEEKESILEKIKAIYPEAHAILTDRYSGCLEWSVSSMSGKADHLPGKDQLKEILKFCSEAKQHGIGWITCRNALLRAIQLRVEMPSKSRTLCLTRADAAQALLLLQNMASRNALRVITRAEWEKSAAKRSAAEKVEVHPVYGFPVNLDQDVGKDAIRRATPSPMTPFPDFTPLPQSRSGDLQLTGPSRGSSFIPINPSSLRQTSNRMSDDNEEPESRRRSSGNMQLKRLSGGGANPPHYR